MSREDEIRERLEAATPGPWFQGRERIRYERAVDVYSEREPSGTSHDITTADHATDAALIANTPADLAYLLAENARVRAQLDTVRELADRATPLRGFGGEFPGVVSVTDLRAALNQGGETDG